jgi:hypothetical protein
METENVELGLDVEDEGDEPNREEPPTPVDGDVETIPSDGDAAPSSKKQKKKKKKKARGAAISQEEPEIQSPIEPGIQPPVEHKSDDPAVDDLAEPMQELKVDTPDVQEDGNTELNGTADNQTANEASAPSKRDKRRAREAAKKAQGAETPEQVRIVPRDTTALVNLVAIDMQCMLRSIRVALQALHSYRGFRSPACRA